MIKEKEPEKKEEKVFVVSENKGNRFNIKSEEMLEAGLHFGHKVSSCHPKMKPYLFGVRSTVHIIDLEKTAQKLEEALDFIQRLISERKALMIVGTKIQMKDFVKEVAEDCGLPYVNERWIGGTFTNFNIIKKRIDHFKDLEEKKVEKELDKYTKKERLKIDKELGDFQRKFGGIKNLEKVPEAVFILDIRKDELAIKESKKKGIKVIAIVDTNVNPDLVDYPIPANDDAISSIKYILGKVSEVIKEAKKGSGTKKETVTKTGEETKK